MKKYFTLILATFVVAAYAQAQTTLRGKVSDEKGEAIIGASVYLKGTSVGASTDMDGRYQINIPADAQNGTIAFSAIGYITQEVSFSGRTELNVTLVEDAQVLSQVVITGYQTEERGKVTGAVSSVKPDVLLRVPVPTLDQALQGRVAGVVVQQNTGAPGEGVSIRIRGVGSVNSGNYPLYVVDGIPTLDISSFSINDFETINILKDASAAALYGSRAGNGVVVVTTKSGKEGPPRVQINSQVGVQSPSRLIDMANTKEYVNIFNAGVANDNLYRTGTLRTPISPTTAQSFADVDYIDAIMQSALIQSHSISISGKQGKTAYLISGSYFDQEGIIKSSDYKRLTGKVNVDTEVKEWLHAGVNLNITNAKTNLIPSSGDGAGGNGGSVVRYAFFRTPAIPVYDENGNFTDLPTLSAFLGDGYNPVGMLAYNQNERTNNRLFGKTYLKVSPIQGLTLVSNFGFDTNNQHQRRFDRNWGTNGRINDPNRLLINTSQFLGLTFSNFLTYDKSFDKHNLSFLLGTEAIKNKTYVTSATDRDFADQKRSLVYLGAGQGIKVLDEGQTGNSLLSYFGKVSYDYADKYLASVTVRRDGSSRFGSANRWGTFYAGSLGWQLAEEDFIKNIGWVDGLLLRMGYGRIGNQEISDYPYLAEVSDGYDYPFGDVRAIGYAVSKLGNNKIKWESSNQFNAGLNFEAWKGSLFVTLDFYNKVTSDLLVSQSIATSAGSAAEPIVNNGKVLNRGIEILITHTKTINDFQYSVTGNFSTVHNEVLAVSPIIDGGAIGATNITRIEKGYPIGSFYLYEMEGIFQDETDVITSPNQGGNIRPGDVKYKDVNGDNVIDGRDRRHVGSPIPDFTAALNISLSYKNWDLSIFFQGAYGQEIFSVLNRDIEGFYRPFNVTQRYYDNYWRGAGTSNKYPRPTFDGANNNTIFSTRFLENGSYTRLKNLQLGYSLPGSFLSRYGFTTVRIYASANNLLTFTKYSGMDPEMTVSDNALGQGERAAGMDWGTYPSARSFNMGINLTF